MYLMFQNISAEKQAGDKDPYAGTYMIVSMHIAFVITLLR